MAYLFVDTSHLLHVGVLDKDFKWLKSEVVETRKTSEILHEIIRSILEECRIEIPKLQGLITIAGPGSYTGMRVGDLINLDFNIVGDYIQYKQEKTGRRVAIPVTDKIRKYLHEVESISSDVLLNRHIKTCCKLAGISNWKKVTSHTMRRTLATNDFILGVPNKFIMAITGHQTEKSFMKYIRLSKTEEANLYAKFKSQLMAG